ncbi:hypothetical protein PWT90_06894 [Aphanocladium album]|nr:hypothetical protein PWT90_06894 [Aphanocladium album]
MADDLDRSLLDRLQALRGGSAGSQPSLAPQKIKVDVIERAKTPTREDALTARLKSLREGSATPEPERRRASPKPVASRTAAPSEKQNADTPVTSEKYTIKDENIEEILETDDDTLQELLADVTPDEERGAASTQEPSDEQVKALLEKLANDIPKDTDEWPKYQDSDGDELDSDDSDSEAMKRKVKDVMERLQDEAELEASHSEKDSEVKDFQDPHDEAIHDTAAADLGLPSVPSDLQEMPSSPGASKQGKPDLDDIAARMAALRAPSHNTDGGGDDDEGSPNLPSVPTSRPSAKPAKRLESRTKYTDDDVDSWCTVCLEDATLRCLGCDDDVYCARCWREMHISPAAAFDDRSHRAVQFTKDKKKKEEPRKVALGA